MNYIGVDIGGTKIYAVRYRVAKNGRMVQDESQKKPTDFYTFTQADKGKDTVYENIKTAIEAVQTKNTKAIGVSWAGFINSRRGLVRYAPNIGGFENFPLTKRLQADCKIPVFLENDARIFAYAEAHQPNKRVPSVLLGIVIGTGVGSGLILKGNVFHGSDDFAGEVGHMIVKNQEIESQISGPAVMSLWKEQVDKNSDLDFIAKKISEKKADIFPIFADKINSLGLWLSNLVLAYDPAEIVFGGTIGRKFWSYWEQEIIDTIYRSLAKYPSRFSLRFSEYENIAPLGAALLAKDKLRR